MYVCHCLCAIISRLPTLILIKQYFLVLGERFRHITRLKKNEVCTLTFEDSSLCFLNIIYNYNEISSDNVLETHTHSKGLVNKLIFHRVYHFPSSPSVHTISAYKLRFVARHCSVPSAKSCRHFRENGASLYYPHFKLVPRITYSCEYK